MASGNFDPSLTKYKPQKQESLSVSDLFQRFVEYKRRKIEFSTLAKYLGLQKHVSLFFSFSVTKRVFLFLKGLVRNLETGYERYKNLNP
jgi:integrase